MGYTHYFGPTDFKPERFALLTKAAKRVIKIVEEEMKVPLAYDLDEADRPPVCEGDTIRFNGIDADGYETFVLRAIGKWSFCKTARKPYDVATVAILCLAKHYNKNLDIGSDGDGSDWEKGLALARRIEPECQLPLTPEED